MAKVSDKTAAAPDSADTFVYLDSSDTTDSAQGTLKRATPDQIIAASTAATAGAQGAVELATDAEAKAGSDTARAVTAANLQAVAKAAGHVHADWYSDDIQSALDAASTAGVPVVKLDATKTYQISSTLTVPSEITLDGGGRMITSKAVGAAQNKARIQATTDIVPMVQLSGNYAGIVGCWIDGDNTDSSGILCDDIVMPFIRWNFIGDMHSATSAAYGVALGHVIYGILEGNITYDIQGWGLDSQDSYGTGAGYYGINVGVSRMNLWTGAQGGMRHEGILTSISDDFEGAPADYMIKVSGSNASRLTMLEPYIEMSGTTPKAYYVGNSMNLFLFGGKSFGNNASRGDFVTMDTAAAVVVTGHNASRFDNLYTGTFGSNADIEIHGDYSNYNTDWSVTTQPRSAIAADIRLPDFVWTGKYKTWTDISAWNPHEATVHVINLASPDTLSFTSQIKDGHAFTVHFKSGNVTVNDGFHDFVLAANADVTPPAGTVMSFLCDNAWEQYEIGDLSRRLAQSYTITNDSTDRTFDANSTTVAELADVVATLIKDLGMDA